MFSKGLHDTDLCRFCGDNADTTVHVMTDCPSLDYSRLRACCVRNKVEFNVSHLLTNPKLKYEWKNLLKIILLKGRYYFCFTVTYLMWILMFFYCFKLLLDYIMFIRYMTTCSVCFHKCRALTFMTTVNETLVGRLKLSFEFCL